MLSRANFSGKFFFLNFPHVFLILNLIIRTLNGGARLEREMAKVKAKQATDPVTRELMFDGGGDPITLSGNLCNDFELKTAKIYFK